jgi:hypothetical protein
MRVLALGILHYLNINIYNICLTTEDTASLWGTVLCRSLVLLSNDASHVDLDSGDAGEVRLSDVYDQLPEVQLKIHRAEIQLSLVHVS